MSFSASSFSEAATHTPRPCFAAVDGAQFDDLPTLLTNAGLSFRSLFLGHADEEAERVGPWFFDVSPPCAMESFLALLGDRPAAVLWSCPSGETALYRHLRGLNMAVVPLLRDGAPERHDGAARPAEDYRDEHVLFRHFDPRVLTQVLPVLDEGQFARVLGPASLIVLPREGGGRPRFAPALDHAVVVPHGPLRLRPEQMDEISDIRVQESRRKIMAYLRDVAPDQTRGLGDRELYGAVRCAETTARAYGVRSERAIGLWAYMLVTSSYDFTQDWLLKRFMNAKDIDATPDERVHMLMRERTRQLRGAKP